MATPAAKPEAEKKIAACLDCSKQLLKRLESSNLNAVAIQELESVLDFKCPRPPLSKAAEFDHIGTQMWNSAMRLRDQSSPLLDTWPHLESQLRVLAFFLLENAQQSYMKHEPRKSTQNLVRIVKTALRAARTCIHANALALCVRLFEKVANHLEHKLPPPPDYKRDKQESEAEQMLKELTADYYLLRATTSWKQEKPDTIVFWLSKVMLISGRADMLQLAEKKADLTYEIGKTALMRKQFHDAVKWIEQSYAVFDDIDPDLLSSELCDLRVIVMLDLARALVGVGDTESLEKASNLIALLDQENGFKTEVYLMRLEIIYAQKPFQADEFHGALSRIIRTTIITEGTFQAVMYQIQKLNRINLNKESISGPIAVTSNTPGPYSQLACQSLDLLLSRILSEPTETQGMVEKVVVTRIWISSLSLQAQDHPPVLQSLFDDILHSVNKKLGLEATHASQSLIWKAVTGLQQVGNETEATNWCTLARHAIFESAGELNKAKLSRKLLTVALARGDTTSARECYYQMSNSGKAAAMTKYLMYKIALQTGDADLAAESLQGLLKACSDKGSKKYLYACALEAQQMGDRTQFVATMNKILEFYERGPPDDIRLPVLLRCIAGTITSQINDKDMPVDARLGELCRIFEAAVKYGSTFKDADTDQDIHLIELRWFACHGYNTALKYCSDMNPKLLLRFMMATITFIDLLRQAGEKDTNLLGRILLCRFLATSTLIVLARAEDNIEKSLQLYLDARRQIEVFHQGYNQAIQDQNLQPDTLSDLEMKEFEMIQFDLEALMKLEHWNDLDKTLAMCLNPQHTGRLESAADLILHIHTYITKSGHQQNDRLQTRVPNVMEKIINTCWRNNKDVIRLARWIRCMFQMTLLSDPNLALRCLDQAHAIASKAQSSSRELPEPYPQDELEWLATVAFNHAVDLWFASVDEGKSGEGTAGIWGEKALMLAGVAGGDGGELGLHTSLQSKWMKLRAM